MKYVDEWWIVVGGQHRQAYSLPTAMSSGWLPSEMDSCQVKWTVLRPDPAVLIVIFLILKVGVDGQSNGLILLLCGEWKMIADWWPDPAA
jgi:hypothetical protein